MSGLAVVSRASHKSRWRRSRRFKKNDNGPGASHWVSVECDGTSTTTYQVSIDEGRTGQGARSITNYTIQKIPQRGNGPARAVVLQKSAARPTLFPQRNSRLRVAGLGQSSSDAYKTGWTSTPKRARRRGVEQSRQHGLECAHQ